MAVQTLNHQTIFERKAYSKLKEWKDRSKGRSAIMVEGARRVGKSTLVEEFARNEYYSYVLIDFSEENREERNYSMISATSIVC